MEQNEAYVYNRVLPSNKKETNTHKTWLNLTRMVLSEIVEREIHTAALNLCEIQEQAKLIDCDRSQNQGNSYLYQFGEGTVSLLKH